MNYVSEEFDFNNNISNQLVKIPKYGKDWPVVYIIYNDKEAYIGETLDVSIRALQHMENEDRRRLKKMRIISRGDYNKSVILDLESYLIKYMSSDGKFVLQNGNGGLYNHKYYRCEKYHDTFKEIWDELKKCKLVDHDILEIENMDVFKYSPYKSLNDEQYMVVNKIINKLVKNINNNEKSNIVIKGCAGTGKTVVGICLFKMLNQFIVNNSHMEIDEIPSGIDLKELVKLVNKNKDFKMAYVVPMKSFGTTMGKAFKNVKGLKKCMVLSPFDVAKSEYEFDLLIVDEAHRLCRKEAINYPNNFADISMSLGLSESATQLDWIFKKSKHQIFFYDSFQSIKPADVRKEDFDKLINKDNLFELKKQMRCEKNGEKYVDYVKGIFSKKIIKPDIKSYIDEESYDFKLFDDVNEMFNVIKEKNNEYGLCRCVAANDWERECKVEDFKDICKSFTNELQQEFDSYKRSHKDNFNIRDINKKLEKITNNFIKKYGPDFVIDGTGFVWNSIDTDWVNSCNSVNEIGCIHTIQGYDLNYAGVIIGNDLVFDKDKNKLCVIKANYKDRKGKEKVTDEELFQYIINIYQTLLTRGIKGTYVYVSSDNVTLKEYLSKYIPRYKG